MDVFATVATTPQRAAVRQLRIVNTLSRGAGVSPRNVPAETSGRLIAPDVRQLVQPLQIAAPSAPPIRNKRLNINREDGRFPKPGKKCSDRLKVAVDVDEGGFAHYPGLPASQLMRHPSTVTDINYF